MKDQIGLARSIDSNNLWKEVYPRPVQDKITLVGGDRWSCRINSEDCSGVAYRLSIPLLVVTLVILKVDSGLS